MSANIRRLISTKTPESEWEVYDITMKPNPNGGRAIVLKSAPSSADRHVVHSILLI